MLLPATLSMSYAVLHISQMSCHCHFDAVGLANRGTVERCFSRKSIIIVAVVVFIVRVVSLQRESSKAVVCVPKGNRVGEICIWWPWRDGYDNGDVDDAKACRQA